MLQNWNARDGHRGSPRDEKQKYRGYGPAIRTGDSPTVFGFPRIGYAANRSRKSEMRYRIARRLHPAPFLLSLLPCPPTLPLPRPLTKPVFTISSPPDKWRWSPSEAPSAPASCSAAARPWKSPALPPSSASSPPLSSVGPSPWPSANSHQPILPQDRSASTASSISTNMPDSSPAPVIGSASPSTLAWR